MPGDKSWYWQHRHALLGVAAAAAGGYTTYRIYNSSASGTLRKIQTALANYGEGCAAASATFAAVLRDLNGYLQSDKDEVPQSIRQLAKLFQAQEVQASLRAGVSTLVAGVTEQLAAGSRDGDALRGPSAIDKVIEAVLSERGRSLVGLAVSVASRNCTAVFCDAVQSIYRQAAEGGSAPAGPSATAELLAFLASERGERLLSVIVTDTVRNGVGVYVDKTAGVNYYNDLFSSLADPAHKQAVTEVLVAVTKVFCRESVGSYVSSSAAAAARPGGSRAAAPAAAAPAAAAGSGGRQQQGAAASPAGCSEAEELEIDLTGPAPASSSVGAGDMLGFVVQAYRFGEVRQLVADLTRTGTRELVGSLVQEASGSLLQGADVRQLLRGALNKVYVMASMVLFLSLYAASPGAIMHS
jgi:hypothetical protein